MFNKELAVPLILLVMSVVLKTCSLAVLYTSYQSDTQKETDDDMHAHEEGIIITSLKSKKIKRSLA